MRIGVVRYDSLGEGAKAQLPTVEEIVTTYVGVQMLGNVDDIYYLQDF